MALINMSHLEEQFAEPMSRRAALKWIGGRLVETGALVGMNAVMLGNSSSSPMYEERPVADKVASLPKIENLQVRHFSGEIIMTAYDILSEKDNPTVLKAVLGSFFGNFAIAYLLRNNLEKTNKLVGSGSFIVGKAIDIASTITFARYHSDPRFFEYGLDQYFSEANPWVGKHPDVADLIRFSVLTMPATAFAGYKFPFIGRSYLGASAFIAEHNTRGAYFVGLSIDMGDQVKRFISEGRDGEFIINYLNDLKNSQKDSQTTNQNQK